MNSSPARSPGTVPAGFTYRGHTHPYLPTEQNPTGREAGAPIELPQYPTSPWGLQPLGYAIIEDRHAPKRHHEWTDPKPAAHMSLPGGPLWTTNWTHPRATAGVYLNVNLLGSSLDSYGRLTVAILTDRYAHDWASVITGQAVDRLNRSILTTQGHPLWTKPFHDETTFLSALSDADQIMQDAPGTTALAALTPARSSRPN
jgi:hypothetical protein